jgi:succinate dehydrogenase / fumarate reductase, cytochrome b subunit
MTTTAAACTSLGPWLRSSVGRKFIVSLTGLAFSGFALGHMAGNMLMFVSPEAYNRYGHSITSNPLIYVIEAGLVLCLLTHMALALNLALENRRSRGQKPVRAPHGQKRLNVGSRWMVSTGLVLLVFIVLHIKTFKYGPYYEATYGTDTIRDLYRLLVEKFHDPLYLVWYEFSLFMLFVHLRHGISSCVQSLGIASARNSNAQLAGWGFAILVAGGFMLQPLYILFFGGQL